MGENHEIAKSAGESLRRWHRHLWLRGVVAILVVAMVTLGVLSLIEFRNRLHHKMRTHGCYDNLRELALVCKMWENEHDDGWPRLSDVPGDFMFDSDALSDYVSRPSLLQCPRDLSAPPSDEFPGDTFYIYLGPGLETEEEALAFLDAYLEAARAGEPLPMPEYDAQAFESIQAEDIYRRLSEMPVAFDRPKNHNNESINVLDANGNVQWRKMGTTYPATTAFWDKLADVEAEIDRIGGQPGGAQSTAPTSAQ